jgi:hypothetical protein
MNPRKPKSDDDAGSGQWPEKTPTSATMFRNQRYEYRYSHGDDVLRGEDERYVQGALRTRIIRPVAQSNLVTSNPFRISRSLTRAATLPA